MPENDIEDNSYIHDNTDHAHQLGCTNRGGDCNDVDLDTVDIELQRIILTSSVHTSPTPPASKHSESFAGSAVSHPLSRGSSSRVIHIA